MRTPLLLPLALLILLSAHSSASAETKRAAPTFSAVQSLLCSEYNLKASDCRAGAFDTPIALDLSRRGPPTWLYVSLEGADEGCYIRHVCFSIIQRQPRGWRSVLQAMGSSVAFRGKSRTRGVRNLLVAGANSASEFHVREYEWTGTRYRARRVRNCSYERPSKGLCRAQREEQMLQ